MDCSEETKRLGVFDRNQNSRLRVAWTGNDDLLGDKVKIGDESRNEEDEQKVEEWKKETPQTQPNSQNCNADGNRLEPRQLDIPKSNPQEMEQGKGLWSLQQQNLLSQKHLRWERQHNGKNGSHQLGSEEHPPNKET